VGHRTAEKRPLFHFWGPGFLVFACYTSDASSPHDSVMCGWAGTRFNLFFILLYHFAFVFLKDHPVFIESI
jgi:hypothetical protein